MLKVKTQKIIPLKLEMKSFLEWSSETFGHNFTDENFAFNGTGDWQASSSKRCV